MGRGTSPICQFCHLRSVRWAGVATCPGRADLCHDCYGDVRRQRNRHKKPRRRELRGQKVLPFLMEA